MVPMRYQTSDEFVVHHFVANIDRRPEFFQGALDDGDGALDTGTETAGIGEDDLHYMIPMIFTAKRMVLPAIG